MRLNKGELDWGLIGSRTVALMIVGAAVRQSVLDGRVLNGVRLSSILLPTDRMTFTSSIRTRIRSRIRIRIRIRIRTSQRCCLRDRYIHPGSRAVHRLFEWMTLSRNTPPVVLVNC